MVTQGTEGYMASEHYKIAMGRIHAFNESV